MKAGTATTTTHAPSVNFETRKTMVAMAVMHGTDAVDDRPAASNPAGGFVASARPARSATG